MNPVDESEKAEEVRSSPGQQGENQAQAVEEIPFIDADSVEVNSLLDLELQEAKQLAERCRAAWRKRRSSIEEAYMAQMLKRANRQWAAMELPSFQRTRRVSFADEPLEDELPPFRPRLHSIRAPEEPAQGLVEVEEKSTRDLGSLDDQKPGPSWA